MFGIYRLHWRYQGRLKEYRPLHEDYKELPDMPHSDSADVNRGGSPSHSV